MNLSHRTCMLALLGVTVAACGGGGDANPPGAAKAGNRPAAKVVVLKLADRAGTRDVSEFVAAVERLSHGTLRIDVSDGWRPGEIEVDRGTLDDVRTGKVDMANIAATSWDRLGVKTLQPLVAPLLVDSLALQARVITDPVGRQMLEGVNRAGVTAIGLLPSDVRHLATFDGGPLLGPSTYRGRTIGIRLSDLSAASLRALGARAEGYVGGGELPGLNGLEADLPTLNGNTYDRPKWSLTGNVAFWPRTLALVLGPAAAARLSPAQQRLLRKAASEAAPAAIRRLERAKPTQIANLCARHLNIVQASEADLVDLRTALTPVRDAISADPQSRAALARIDALKRELGAPADTVPTCPAPEATPPPTAAVPKALKGTWKVSFTRKELVAAHPNPGEPIDINWGTFFLAIGDRRFTISGCPGALTCSPGHVGDRGTVTVNGNRITFTLSTVPEAWRYYWSVYRDRLTFRRIPGDTDNPTGFIVKPHIRWTR
jgi:TRAP-type C4-dicarboxylate transport system substrate-binding protein